MKYLITILLTSLLVSCGNKDKQQKIKEFQNLSEETVLAPKIDDRIGHWIEIGKECYGIVLLTKGKTKNTEARPVKARVLLIEPFQIKMKALEDVNFGPSIGCEKLGIFKGETWWEREGDLFQSKADAEKFIKDQGININSKGGARFTID